MEKEVLVSINGIQFMESDEDSMEVISLGEYYFRNGKHYIMYDETIEDSKAEVKNILKISDNSVELIKSGGYNAHLIFEKSKRNMSCYETDFGSLMLGFHAKNIEINNNENEINVFIEYSVEMNYEHVSDNKLSMNIQSKSQATTLNLQ